MPGKRVRFSSMKLALPAIFFALALVACSSGLSEDEVREIVDEAVATAVVQDLPSDDVLSVRQIELRDEQGRLRGRLGVNSVGNSELALFDAESDLFPRITTSVGEAGETLMTFWRTDGQELGVGLQVSEAGIGLVDSNGVIRLALALSGANGDTPLLGLRNRAGNVTVGVTDIGLSVRDAEGNLLFTAPETSETP